MEYVTVILPCYNEESRVSPTLRGIAHFMREHPGIVEEVIIVDDCSIDSTVERCMYFVDKIPLKVERLFRNSGKWAALHHGMRSARTDWVLLMDADGSAGIDELLNLPPGWEPLKTAYFGSRFAEGSSVEGKTFLRSVVSWCYRLYARFWLWVGSGRRDVDDLQCPWKLLRRSSILNRNAFLVDRFAGDIELACRLNADVETLPVRFHHVRGSKVPMSAVFNMAVETVRVAMRERLLRTGK